MQTVKLRENAEKASYYKFIVEMDPLSDELREFIKNSKGTLEDTLDPKDRCLLQKEERYPKESGYYPLKDGGFLIASNVEIPDITGEMIAWWASWHSLDSLRYALWDPEDHYDVKVDDVGRERALDPNVPVFEKLWYATHNVYESLDCDEPQPLTMHFLNPGDAGYDMSLLKTPLCEYILCGNALLDGQVPVFMTENFLKINGVMEVRLRYWLGYQLEDGEVVCKIPPTVQLPEAIGPLMITHNFKEYHHLNKVLPAIYAQEKDNWEVTI